MNIFERQQRCALARMKSLRTCPPTDILIKGGDRVALHLIFCDRCRKLLKLANGIDFTKTQQAKEKIKKNIFKGSVCQIVRDSSIDIYQDGKWFIPPIVAVCEEIKDDKNQNILVAILHDAQELAADDDIILSGKNKGWFLESWNTFYINTSWLDYLDVQITNSEIDIFLAKHNNIKINIEYDSLIYEFRKIELEVAEFYKNKCSVQFNNLYKQTNSKDLKIQTFLDTEIDKILYSDDIALAALSEYKSPLDMFPELCTINGRIIIINSDNKPIVRYAKFTYINGRLSTSIEWQYKDKFEVILLPQISDKYTWSYAKFLISNNILTIYSDFLDMLNSTEITPLSIIKIL